MTNHFLIPQRHRGWGSKHCGYSPIPSSFLHETIPKYTCRGYRASEARNNVFPWPRTSNVCVQPPSYWIWVGLLSTASLLWVIAKAKRGARHAERASPAVEAPHSSIEQLFLALRHRGWATWKCRCQLITGKDTLMMGGMEQKRAESFSGSYIYSISWMGIKEL